MPYWFALKKIKIDNPDNDVYTFRHHLQKLLEETIIDRPFLYQDVLHPLQTKCALLIKLHSAINKIKNNTFMKLYGDATQRKRFDEKAEIELKNMIYIATYFPYETWLRSEEQQRSLWHAYNALNCAFLVGLYWKSPFPPFGKMDVDLEPMKKIIKNKKNQTN